MRPLSDVRLSDLKKRFQLSERLYIYTAIDFTYAANIIT